MSNKKKFKQLSKRNSIFPEFLLVDILSVAKYIYEPFGKYSNKEGEKVI